MILIVFLFLVKLYFLSQVEVGLLFLFLKGVGEILFLQILFIERLFMLCVFLNKSLLERFFSIILPTSLVFLWNLGFVEEL